MSVTYTAVLPVGDHTVLYVSSLLHAQRRRLGTRAGTRSLSCYREAILVLRRLLDGTRIAQLAADNVISRSTGYTYLHEGLTLIAERAPSLNSAPLAAKTAGYSHVTLDGTLIETDRCRTPGPTPGVDLWWSGKHDNHGGNVQVITAPDGWPLWTSPVRPGHEHDTTALRHHDILPLLTAWTDDPLRVLGDLGYEGERATITVAFKKPKNRACTHVEQHFNRAHNAVRAIGERGNSLLKTTLKALRNVSICPWTISRITAAALVILHIEHGRTT